MGAVCLSEGVSLTKVSQDFNCIMEEALPNIGLGQLIHDSLPDGLHIDPYCSSVTPCSELQNGSSWMGAFVKSVRNGFCEEVSEESSVEEEHSPIADSPSIEPIDNSEEEESLVNSDFPHLLYGVYTSSTYINPGALGRNRHQFRGVWEAYRHWVLLNESSRKPQPASEEVINNLGVVRVSSSVFPRNSSFLWNGVRFAWMIICSTHLPLFFLVYLLLVCEE